MAIESSLIYPLKMVDLSTVFCMFTRGYQDLPLSLGHKYLSNPRSHTQFVSSYMDRIHRIPLLDISSNTVDGPAKSKSPVDRSR